MDDIATEIVTIPRKFHTRAMSIFDLLKETGYFELHNEVSVSDIRNALARDPACVQEWMQYIDDQRCSSSWYLVLNDEGLYEVGFYDSNTDPARSNQVVYRECYGCVCSLHQTQDKKYPEFIISKTTRGTCQEADVEAKRISTTAERVKPVRQKEKAVSPDQI